MRKSHIVRHQIRQRKSSGEEGWQEAGLSQKREGADL